MPYPKELKEKLAAEITTIPGIVNVSHFPALDGLRGLAVLLVVLYHFGFNYFLRPLHMLINSEMGVNMFFVISGFLITTLLLKEKVKYGQISLKRFYARRALKVIPVAYLFLLVLIILTAVYKFRISMVDFAASFLFYKNLPYQSEPYSGHFWSLAAEVQFYLLFPFMLYLNVNRYFITVVSLVIVILVISLFGYYHPVLLPGSSLIQTVAKIAMYIFWKGPFVILIGSLCALLLFKGIIKVKAEKGNYFLSFAVLIAAIAISSTSFIFYSKYISEFLSAILIAIVILLNLGKRNLLSAILGSRVLVWAGTVSYSLYVWQQLFLGNQTWQPWLRAFHSYSPWALIVLKLLIVLIIASLSYYFVEVRFQRLKDKYEQKNQPKSP